jgi:hypothetical protein
VSQINGGVRTYGFELVVVLLMVTGMLEVQLRRASPDAPHTPLWFQLSAIAVLVLPLYARRRNTFAAATTYWLLAVGLSFIDGRLVPFVASVFVLGMAASYLLGNLRDAVQVRIGLAVVLTGAAVVVYNLPDHSASQLLFIPLPFACAGSRAARCASGPSRPKWRKCERPEPNGSATQQHASQSPRNGLASRGRCTTSLPTQSA